MIKHRICKKCGGRIKKVHRWHVVHHRFLFLRWDTVEHRDCARPEMVHKNVVPLALEMEKFRTLLPCADISLGRPVPRMPENEDGVHQTYVEGL